MPNNSSFLYAAEKLSAARRALMLPHPRGEAADIADAFHECSLGLHDVPGDALDENSRSWVRELTDLMNADGVVDSTGRGTWVVKAERMTLDDKVRVSLLVDDLAEWFDYHSDL